MVTTVHAIVEGRVRLKVEVHSNPQRWKQYLEFRLKRESGVLHAQANPITGHLLIRFESPQSHAGLAGLVERVLTEGKAGSFHLPDPPPSTALPGPPRTGGGLGPRPVHPSMMRPELHALYPLGEGLLEMLCSMECRQILAVLRSDRERGLSAQEVELRRERWGRNALPAPPPRSDWALFASQLKSTPVMLLGLAAGISVLTGGFFDAVVIAGVIGANAAVGFFTEKSAERIIQGLRNIKVPPVEVLREARHSTVNAEDLVIGDILVLRAGMLMPADVRLLVATGLSVDESPLTGESHPVEKTASPIAVHHLPINERNNMAFAGTRVLTGQGLAVVVATGRTTELGRIQELLDTTHAPKTPLQSQMEGLGEDLGLLFLAVSGLFFGAGFARGFGLLELSRLTISLAAASVPEGLPAATTTTLAIGVRRMKRHNISIRQLEAIETLGAVQVVCFDKTGTLTENSMEIGALHTAAGLIEAPRDRSEAHGLYETLAHAPDLQLLLRIGALCNECTVEGVDGPEKLRMQGSSTECALLRLAETAGTDILALRQAFPVLETLPRTEREPIMATVHDREGRRVLYLKGSPAHLLSRCSTRSVRGRVVRLSERARKEIHRANEKMARDGLRVLGMAYKPGEPAAPLEGLTWVGLVGMADPIRSGTRGLIRSFHRAGIGTALITGDQQATARSVAEELQIHNGSELEVLDGTELELLDARQIRKRAGRVHVFSRISPGNKLKVVQALQAAGKVVAMTGDGINDGPALKAADVGIAMGAGGTDLSRDSADLVLLDDKLESLLVAIREGRTTYENIRKAVWYFLSTNLSEIMVMLSSMVVGTGVPLNARQLLWINLISDVVPGLALAFEPPEEDVLSRSPRESGARLISRHAYLRMGFESTALSSGALAAYLFGLARYGAGPKASSLAFQSLTIAQLLHALSCRSPYRKPLATTLLPNNPYLAWGLAGSLGLQLLTSFLPGLRGFLGLSPLGWSDWLVVLGAAVIPLLLNELTKRAEPQTEKEAGRPALVLLPAPSSGG